MTDYKNLKLIATSSKSFESYPYALLNNDPTAEWNPAYTSELLPLFDVLIDSIGKFDFCEVKHAVVLLSYFCRFVSSSDEDVNQSIRIKYNEWIEEFFSHVPYQTNASILKIQMSAVSRTCLFCAEQIAC